MMSVDLIKLPVRQTAGVALAVTALALAACGGGGGDSGSASTVASSSTSSVSASAVYAVSGTVTGVTSAGLVLSGNGTMLTVPVGATSFALGSSLSAGSSYSITVQTPPAGYTCSVANGAGTIAAASVTNVAVTCAPMSYTLGGTISGLGFSGLMLANNGVSLTVPANATSFTFGPVLNAGTAYSVSIQSSPSGLTCSVAGGTGATGSANVGNVVVTCSPQSFTLGGTISGLASGGLVLANGATTLTVAANATSFTLPGTVAFGSSYSVTVQSQPSAQNCAVSSYTGSMPAANVVNVTVNCSAKPFNLGGTISGLTTATGLVLANGSDSLTVAAGATTFTMPTKVAFGATYALTIRSQPTGRSCSVGNATGTMSAADVTTVTVTCSILSYTVGGTISGLTVAGLKLANGAEVLTISSGATGFTFASVVASGGTYAVSANAQPTGKTCSVANGSGTVVGSNVTNVAVTCATNAYTLGGTITGLTSSGLVLNNNGDTVSPSANAAQFTFPTGVAYQGSYSVSVTTQPTGLNCSVGNATGTMPAANVSSLQIGCSAMSAGSGWAWQGGSSSQYSGGTYGFLGVASSSNVPGSRYQAVTWIDGAGYLWLGQGYGADGNGSFGRLGDIWKYNRSTRQWTWVHGSNQANPYPNWGTKGTAAASNDPGGRQGALFWQDSAGNLWMFGGSTLGVEYVLCNDLWKYDITANLWTWINGPNTCTAGVTGVSNSAYTWETTTGNGAVFGTQGTPNAANIPSNRRGSATWVDASGNLWLFGGIGYDATTGYAQFYSDLWRYQPSTGSWTWMGGPQSANQNGAYGTLGSGSTSNIPPARQQMANWTDTAGNLWLFGGQGAAGGSYNDLWKYNIASGQWTWVSGSNGYGSAGVYGTLGVPSSSNVPGARNASTGWIDTAGTLWLFGGSSGKTNGYTDNFSDLWNYQPSTGRWTWWRGPNVMNVAGAYGTPQVAATTNSPGARNTAAAWIDPANGLWLFGGEGKDGGGGQGLLNDLWKY